MSFKMIFLSVPMMFAIGGCDDSKKAEEPAKPVAQEPAPKADPPAKVDVHITTDHQPAPEPEPKRSGVSVTVEGEADFEVK